MNKVEVRNNDGSYQRWSINKYHELRRHRGLGLAKELGVVPGVVIPNHPAVGKQFYHVYMDNTVVTITKVVKHWFAGYYYVATYEDQEGYCRGTTYIENINCILRSIADGARGFNNRFVEVK